MVTLNNVTDSIQFQNLIPQNADPYTLLAIFDVTSLYRNILHELREQALEYWIKKHPDFLHNRFSEEFITDSIDMFLTNNDFQFDNNNYLQVLRTAMWTIMVPSYSGPTLTNLDETFYEK